MSDDRPTPPSDDAPADATPTERFDAQPGTEWFDAQPGDAGSYDATRLFPVTPPNPGADRPTELIQRSGPPVPHIPSPSASAAIAAAASKPRSRALMYTLIGVAAALLVGIIVLLVIQLTPGTGTPEATSTPTTLPTSTPVVTPSAEPTPVAPVAPATPPGPIFDAFSAPESAGCVDGDITRPLTFTWASANAQTAYIGVATTNAQAAPYESDLPTTYRYTNLAFDCALANQVYTVTLEDDAGLLAHRTVTVLR